jgi:pantoate--beta-alanine ligase
VQIIRDLAAMRIARASLVGTVAMVPTMGALHAGHMKLIEAAVRQADHVIASIFVNPMQFAPTEDLSRYPRREEADAAMLAGAGVAILWAPDVATMYPDGFATTVSVAGVSQGLCGASRPGHFDGVATVVAKLFGQARPDMALFGEKDWQQLQVIRRMVTDLDLGIDIIGVPTEREVDGLAMSSRNAYLSPADRKAAVALPRALVAAADALAKGDEKSTILAKARAEITAAGLEIDYVERREDRILAAARIGTTRLIDNFPIRQR